MIMFGALHYLFAASSLEPRIHGGSIAAQRRAAVQASLNAAVVAGQAKAHFRIGLVIDGGCLDVTDQKQLSAP